MPYGDSNDELPTELFLVAPPPPPRSAAGR
jgi:hypothetical protein